MALTMVVLCVAGKAAATGLAPADMAGRWIAEKQKLTIDITPCGNDWCGVEVGVGNVCGRTVLRVALKEQRANSVSLSGKLELTPQAQPYFVAVELYRADQGDRLLVIGDSSDHFEPWRRTFPFNALLARTGAGQCSSDTASF